MGAVALIIPFKLSSNAISCRGPLVSRQHSVLEKGMKAQPAEARRPPPPACSQTSFSRRFRLQPRHVSAKVSLFSLRMSDQLLSILQASFSFRHHLLQGAFPTMPSVLLVAPPWPRPISSDSVKTDYDLGEGTACLLPLVFPCSLNSACNITRA